MEIVQLLSAAGIGGVVGSLLTTLVQAWIAQRSYLANRNFHEKKEAYVGYLEALYRSEIEMTPEASLRVGHWQDRCELVGPNSIRDLIQLITETNPEGGHVHPKRRNVVKNLKAAMRVDLGVQP